MDSPPAGHCVPPEILADILLRLRNDNNTWYGGMWDRRSLTPLLVCSLVCRHWAQICRPIMFKNIIIRSEAHLSRLLPLLSSPSPVAPSLRDCIQVLDIDDSGKQQKPWIHQVSLIQPNVSTYAAWDLIRLHDTSYPSIYGHIPRMVPRGLLKFKQITFTNVRFRRVHDLLRIIRDLPNLDDLQCSRVSFDDETVPDEDAIHIGRETHIKDEVNLYLDDYGGLSMDRRRFFFALCSAFSRRIAQLDAQLWRTFGQLFALFLVIENGTYARFEATPTEVSCWDSKLDLELYPLELKATYEGDEAPGTFFRPPHDWDSLETLLLGLHPTHSLQLSFWNATVFKTTLDAVVEGRLLQRLHAAGQVDVTYFSRSMKRILALPAEHDIDGHHLVLKASQRFELYSLRESERRQTKYLRKLVAAQQAASNLDGGVESSESDAAEGAGEVEGSGEGSGEVGSDEESKQKGSDELEEHEEEEGDK